VIRIDCRFEVGAMARLTAAGSFLRCLESECFVTIAAGGSLVGIANLESGGVVVEVQRLAQR
jgi:hypothetical protein